MNFLHFVCLKPIILLLFLVFPSKILIAGKHHYRGWPWQVNDHLNPANFAKDPQYERRVAVRMLPKHQPSRPHFGDSELNAGTSTNPFVSRSMYDSNANFNPFGKKMRPQDSTWRDYPKKYGCLPELYSSDSSVSSNSDFRQEHKLNGAANMPKEEHYWSNVNSSPSYSYNYYRSDDSSLEDNGHSAQPLPEHYKSSPSYSSSSTSFSSSYEPQHYFPADSSSHNFPHMPSVGQSSSSPSSGSSVSQYGGVERYKSPKFGNWHSYSDFSYGDYSSGAFTPVPKKKHALWLQFSERGTKRRHALGFDHRRFNFFRLKRSGEQVRAEAVDQTLKLPQGMVGDLDFLPEKHRRHLLA